MVLWSPRFSLPVYIPGDYYWFQVSAIKAVASRHKKVMLSISLFEFQMIEEDFFL